MALIKLVKGRTGSFDPLLFFAVTAFAIILWSVSYIYLNSEKNSNIKTFLDIQTQRQLVSWDTVSKMDEAYISAYFDMYVQREEVTTLLAIANYGDNEQRDEARKRVYDLLLPAYQKLTDKNIIQFHFQTTNNDSFLRFHMPHVYGDSLNTTRPAIVAVNKTKKPIFGFETGKVAQSFRGIFPIFHEGEHVGSVDMGRPFLALKNELEKVHPGAGYIFLIRAKDAMPKLFSIDKGLYNSVFIDEEWLAEKGCCKKLLGGCGLEIFKKLLNNGGGLGTLLKAQNLLARRQS